MTNLRLWVSCHQHSSYSLLDGIARPDQIIETALDNGLSGCAITDHGNLAGVFPYLKAKKQLTDKYTKLAEKANSEEEKDRYSDRLVRLKDFKQILGIELYLSPNDSTIKTKENGKHSHLVTLAKNEEGWRNILRITAEANRSHNFYHKPRIDLKRLGEFTKGTLIGISGHAGSDLANCIFTNHNLAYNSRSYEEAKSFIDPEWKKKLFDLIGFYIEIYGKENFFIEIQDIDDRFPAGKVIVQAMRFAAKKLGVRKVATADSHYLRRENAEDQRILLCKNTTLKAMMARVEDDEDEVGLGGFFRSDSYHIPTLEEVNSIYEPDEIENSLLIAGMCDDYNIFYPPSLPNFDCPNGMNTEQYLRQLCRDGFKRRTKGRVENEQVYFDRIKQELGVFNKFDVLEKYFLIVYDYINAARARGELIGPARGSSAGCLTTYWLGITSIDPIPIDLSFGRFYNDGRNSADHVSIPDVDVDFEIEKREQTINYCRQKWGDAHVCQMGTFQRLMGSAAIQTVFRVHEALSPDDVKKITEYMPEEAAISDFLQDMVEDGEEPSIIKWALRHNKKYLKDYCYLDENENLQGEFAKLFAQAMRIEGTVSATSKHASGVIITDFRLEDRIPLMRDKSSDNLLTACDMNSVADLGGTKFDILGLANLTTVNDVSRLLSTGILE